jgi:hypothetical protein
MVLVITLAIAVLMVGFVAAPFFLVSRRGESAVVREEPVAEKLRELLAEKETVYAAIQELDFDFKSGKLSAEDHAALRRRQEAEAAVLLQQIDGLQAQLRTVESRRKARGERRSA